MKKIKILIIILIIISAIIIIMQNGITTDAINFKREYEELNSKEKGIEVKIPVYNLIKYVNIENILNIFEQKQTAVLYIGYPKCPSCRKSVPELIQIAKQTKCDQILYLNITKYNNAFEVKDGNVVKTREEKEGYYELLKVLNEITQDYKIHEEGKEYNVNEKRIYSPTVLKIEKGEIKQYYTGAEDIEEMRQKYIEMCT